MVRVVNKETLPEGPLRQGEKERPPVGEGILATKRCGQASEKRRFHEGAVAKIFHWFGFHYCLAAENR